MLVKKHSPAFGVAPRFFDSFLLKDLFETPVQHKADFGLPAVNVRSTNEAYVVEVAAPGLDKENIKIEMEKDVLTISYQDQHHSEEKQEGYLLREFRSRSFSRSFSFPKGQVNDEQIVAQYTNGVLQLELPKREEAKPKAPRQIQLS